MKFLAIVLAAGVSFAAGGAFAQVAPSLERAPANPSAAIDCNDPAYRMDSRCVGATTEPERPGPAGTDLTTGATPPPPITPPPVVTNPVVPTTPR